MCSASYVSIKWFTKEKSHTHTHTFSVRQANPLPLAAPLAQQEAHGVPRLDPGDGGSQKAAVPQVGQAGVVPQSLREGHGSLVPDSVAPHPEGRGETAG